MRDSSLRRSFAVLPRAEGNGSSINRVDSDDGGVSTKSRTAQSMRNLLGAPDTNVVVKSITQRFPDSERGANQRAGFLEQFGDTIDQADLSSPRTFRELEKMSKSPTRARTSAFARTPGGSVCGPIAPTVFEEAATLPPPRTTSTKRHSMLRKFLTLGKKKNPPGVQ
jgi:hypothetical protein